MLPSLGRVTFLWNGKIWLSGLIWEGDMEEGIVQNIPWGAEKSLAEDDYFRWWKWGWAQKLRGLKQGMGREMPTLNDHPRKCVCIHVSVHAHVSPWVHMYAHVYVFEHAIHMYFAFLRMCVHILHICMSVHMDACFLHVHVFCMHICACVYACTIRESSRKYSVDVIGKCLFVLSLECIEREKFKNGYD